MKTIDINCDMGEGFGNDALIMPFISSANIACGFHAGDENTMKQTVALCLKFGVSIGVHCSFNDKKNFGRTEMQLPLNEIYDLVFQQCSILNEIVKSMNGILSHVKPHGALYNMSAKSPDIAKTIAAAVKNFDSGLLLIGLSGSHSISEAKKLNLQVVNECFADRTYQEDGSLVPRSKPNALLTNIETVVNQVEQIVEKKSIIAITGKEIPILAETICIHGDGPHAVDFAKAIHTHLKTKNSGINA